MFDDVFFDFFLVPIPGRDVLFVPSVWLSFLASPFLPVASPRF